MSDLDHYHRHRSNQADPLAACPPSRLAAGPTQAHAGLFTDPVDALIRGCDFAAGARALDYGCGVGRETDRLAQALSGTALGVDASLPLIREATATPRTRFAHAPNGVVPAGRNGFHVVYVSLVLGGLRGQKLTRAVAELHRVLKPGGLLILIAATGDTSSDPRWTSRSDDAYRALFPQTCLRAEAQLDRGDDRLTLLAGTQGDAPAAAD